ncbi:MAG: glycoside hydrolase family 65 protein, partial [Bacteroidetes bacterium]|nr:glycoside hydrolase family 65 protein [Bacteroidota bacterium]
MKKIINYHQGQGILENGIVTETDFKRKFQGKCEVIFGLGNGYLGIRSSTEESYLGQTRNMFVSGTFNKCNTNEVTELPNAADFIRVDFFINNEILNLEKGTFSNYHRSLNLKNGVLTREFIWISPLGEKFSFCFKRFVSFDNLHTICSKISITPLNCKASILIKSGINGQVTNSGAQHFEEGEKRIFDKEYLQMLQTTNQSGIVFIHNTFHDFKNSDVKVSSRFEIDRRKVSMIYEGEASKGETFEFSKISNIYTSRD